MIKKEILDIVRARATPQSKEDIDSLAVEVERLQEANEKLKEDIDNWREVISMIRECLEGLGCGCGSHAGAATPPMCFPEWIVCVVQHHISQFQSDLKGAKEDHEADHRTLEEANKRISEMEGKELLGWIQAKENYHKMKHAEAVLEKVNDLFDKLLKRGTVLKFQSDCDCTGCVEIKELLLQIKEYASKSNS